MRFSINKVIAGAAAVCSVVAYKRGDDVVAGMLLLASYCLLILDELEDVKRELRSQGYTLDLLSDDARILRGRSDDAKFPPTAEAAEPVAPPAEAKVPGKNVVTLHAQPEG